jgi:class 3 adenylate cyclase/tetratricopeptide (TPR) repeat protein
MALDRLTGMTACPTCGASNPAGARFCNGCGVALAEQRPVEVRKTVTVLFCDVVGSTALGERLDPEAVRRLVGRYFEAARTAVESHGGTVEKFIGDAVMAVFGIPVLHEDDALRAVRAAARIRDAAGELGLATRIGVNTGEVVAGDPAVGQALVTGDAVNVGARLEQAAGTNEIVLGETTYRLVRDAVIVDRLAAIGARGKSEPLVAYRLREVSAEAEGLARRFDAPLVGREDVVQRLASAWRITVDERAPRLLTVVAPAGVGKSRLLRELTGTLAAEGHILRGRCLSYGEGITYWPVAEALRGAAKIEESDSATTARAKLDQLVAGAPDAALVGARLAAAIGLSSDAAPQDELFWAIRRCLEHLARQRPTLLVVEDIHWAEPTLLDLLEYVVELADDAALLILCAARPELLAGRPGWGARGRSVTIQLEPLSLAAAGELLDALPGAAGLPDELRRRVTEAAEGNALFLEEMVAMLREDGSLVATDDGWTFRGEVARVTVPPTVGALVAARIDGLPDSERRVAERAAVVGRVFEAAAVREIAPTMTHDVGRTLLALVRKELIRPDRSELTAGDAFRFRHILLRDAAYQSLPKSERAVLHERVGEWLERVVGGRMSEYEELVGYHFEQAAHYRLELDQSDERLDQLRRRAAVHLEAAGRRAFDRDDLRAAVQFLGRALELAVDDGPWLSVGWMYAKALLDRAELEQAQAAVNEVRARADRAGDAVAAANAQVVETELKTLLGGGFDPRELQQALGAYQPGLHDTELARALCTIGELELNNGRVAAAVAAVRQSLEHARAAGDRAAMDRARCAILGYSLLSAERPQHIVDDARIALREPDATPWLRGWMLEVLRVALAMCGDLDEARRTSGTPLLAELGDRLRLLGNTAQYTFMAERAAGDVRMAERELRDSASGLEQIGELGFYSTVASMLSHVLVEKGEVAEARLYADRARATTAGDDYMSQFLWRTAMARIHAAAGDCQTAQELARSGVDIADHSEAVEEQAWGRVYMAEVLATCGDRGGARTAIEEAQRLFEQKGNVAAAAKARTALAEITAD